MKQVTLQSAREYVGAIQLPSFRASAGFESVDPMLALDADKDQAAVVGSEVVSFAKGVNKLAGMAGGFVDSLDL